MILMMTTKKPTNPNPFQAVRAGSGITEALINATPLDGDIFDSGVEKKEIKVVWKISRCVIPIGQVNIKNKGN